jgi:hypothetical protein
VVVALHLVASGGPPPPPRGSPAFTPPLLPR